jgi:hypothetical protein
MTAEPRDLGVLLRGAADTIDLFDRAASALRSAAVRAKSIVRLPQRGRLLVTGDLHDNPLHLRKTLALARLDASADHHVILHELIHGERLINGMDFSYRMLGQVAHLVLQFPGQVHPLLANHELAQMTGRGVSKGAGNSVELFDEALDYVFGDEAESVAGSIRRFIRAMPLALVSESGLCCAHSLPAPGMMAKFDASVLEREMQDEDYQPPAGAAHLMVWGRGHTAAQVDQLAARWGVSLFCIGHEHIETGIELKHPRLLVLNSDHERGVVLPVELAGPPRADEAILRAVPLAAVPGGA